MPNPSTSTPTLTLATSADILAQVIGGVFTVSMLAGQSVIAPGFITAGTSVWAFVEYVGQPVANGVFVPRDSLIWSNGADLRFRSPLSTPATVYYGSCSGAASGHGFVVPGCNSYVIKNNSADVIYFRKGTPNKFGLTIAKPGDSNGANVIGTRIEANGSFNAAPGSFMSGEEIHLLGNAASLTATVQFT